MNNLTIAVIAIAVAQALTILLIIGREREIKRLREKIAEIKPWLARRMQSAQPRRIKPDREPDEIKVPEIKVPEIKAPEIKVPEIKMPEPAITRAPEPAITPKDLSDTLRPSTTEDDLKRATKAINWLKEDVDKARAIVAAQQVNRIGPVMPLENTAQEVDAEVGQTTVVPMRSITASAVGRAASRREPSGRRSSVPTETK